MLNLQQFFDRAGKTLTDGLRTNIRRQTDIYGRPFSPIATSTAMQRQREKGLGRGLAIRLQTGAMKNNPRKGRGGKLTSSLHVNLHRLMNTNKYLTNAFRYEAGPQSLSVSVSEDEYANGVSYWDITRYNNENSGSTNRFIRRPPLVWPNSDQDVQAMQAMNKVKADFEREVKKSPELQDALLRQIAGDVTKTMTTRINLGGF